MINSLNIKLLKLFSVLAITVFIFYVVLNKPSGLDKDINILIKPGTKTTHIAKILKKNNIIESKYLFLFYSKIIFVNKKIKAGEYAFTAKGSLREVVRKLTKGETLVRKLTIPEGLTAAQIVNILKNEETLSGEINEIPAEGSLFPSTYNYKYGDLRSKILTNMQKEMESNLAIVLSKIPEDSYLKSHQDIITLASIVEKEAANDLEKPIIASVFINRLKLGMKLQADPTVIYGITEGKYVLDRLLTREDLQLATAYNTYHNLGLTPTPIACPGLKSLEAVVSPAKTDYIFFVASGNGGHVFSVTLDEHNTNVRNYRNIIDQKNNKSETTLIED